MRILMGKSESGYLIYSVEINDTSIVLVLFFSFTSSNLGMLMGVMIAKIILFVNIVPIYIPNEDVGNE